MPKFIIANWKMNKTINEALHYIKDLKKYIKNKKAQIVICASFTLLDALNKPLKNSKFSLGAQNVYFEEHGAYTGEISPSMLKELGCEYCIVGHSERRQLFKESDAMVNKKVIALLNHKIIPILCIGETYEQRSKGRTFQVLEHQLRSGLNGIVELKNIIIAYEPVWAIGTGETATPYQAEDAHHFIRKLIAQLHDQKTAQQIPILYGGSVTPNNAKDILRMKNINGALVGGASLDPKSFAEIVNCTR